jgi:acetyl-CoA carboxylase biotin carboxyl carrier protein
MSKKPNKPAAKPTSKPSSKPAATATSAGTAHTAELAKLREIVALMAANDITELSLDSESESIHLKRGAHHATPVHAPVHTTYAAPAPVAAPAAAPAPAPAAAAPAPAPAAPAASSATAHVESPMVGTIYLKPNPDAPEFVKVGQTVTKDSVVCLIEAMKVFNEIKAEKSGVVESILIKSGDAVEFGQKLFALR